jgi:ketosteroid isomerase-like protein
VGVTARSTSSVASLAQAYLDAVSRGDGVGAAKRCFHPDIVYIVNGPPTPVDGLGLPSLSSGLHSGLPWLGVYRGLDQVRAFLTHMRSNLDVTGFGPAEIVGDDNRAAVSGWFGLRSRPAGRGVRSAFSVLLEQPDGKIARYHNGAHLYLQEHNLEGWLARLDELEQLAARADSEQSTQDTDPRAASP